MEPPKDEEPAPRTTMVDFFSAAYLRTGGMASTEKG
jgi:hypothetical protein